MTNFRIKDLNDEEPKWLNLTRKIYKKTIVDLDERGVQFRVETTYKGVTATKHLTIIKVPL